MVSDSIDTNILVHYIINDVPGQREAVTKLLSTPGSFHRVSDLAITETVFVLETVYARSRAEIASLLTLFFSFFSETLSFDRSIFSKVIPVYVSHPKLSFNDCFLANDAEEYSAEPLFTFDKKLAKQHPSAKLLAY